MQLKFSIVGWQRNRLLTFDQFLPLAAVSNQVLDAADFQPVLLLELQELRQSGHRSILVEDFADNGGGIESRQTGQIDRGLCMPRTSQDTALVCLAAERHGPGCTSSLERRIRACKHL